MIDLDDAIYTAAQYGDPALCRPGGSRVTPSPASVDRAEGVIRGFLENVAEDITVHELLALFERRAARGRRADHE